METYSSFVSWGETGREELFRVCPFNGEVEFEVVGKLTDFKSK
jgi:hypothetical protein